MVELVLVLALVGGIVVTVSFVMSSLITQASETNAGEVASEAAFRVVEEMADAIRLAETVHEAGPNLLVVSTRYYYDTDDTLERVRFRLSGTSLTREISQNDGVSYDAPEVLEDDVTLFSSKSFRIEDSFSATDYEVGLDTVPTGTPTLVSATDQASFLVRDLDSVDPDLVASYDAERLLVEPVGFTGTTVTLSPSIPTEDLYTSVQFTPLGTGGGYSPLVFGSMSTNVSVFFGQFGNIRLVTTQSFIPTQLETSPTQWVAGQTYDVSMRFESDAAWAEVRDADGTVVISETMSVPPGMTDGTVSVAAYTIARPGSWDNLVVGYDQVTVELEVVIDGESGMRTAEVTPRSW